MDELKIVIIIISIVQTCILGAQKNRFKEAVLLSSHNMFL